jgi:hypothetical protein
MDRVKMRQHNKEHFGKGGALYGHDHVRDA